MKQKKSTEQWNVELPWSGGCMSAKLWQKGNRVVVSVPELDICCYGKSQSEAVMRLFSTLLKYYRELKGARSPLSERQAGHLERLEIWVRSVERRMTARELVAQKGSP